MVWRLEGQQGKEARSKGKEVAVVNARIDKGAGDDGRKYC